METVAQKQAELLKLGIRIQKKPAFAMVMEAMQAWCFLQARAAGFLLQFWASTSLLGAQRKHEMETEVEKHLGFLKLGMKLQKKPEKFH